jgi:ribonuclease G
VRSWFRRTLSRVEQAAEEAPSPDIPDASLAPSGESTSPELADGSDKPKRRATRGGRGQKKKQDDAGGSAPSAKAGEETPPAKKKRKAPSAKVADGKGDSEAQRRSRRRSETARRSTLPAVRKEMLVSIDTGEQRVAVLEDGQVVEVYLERPGRRSIAGNAYKGTVDTVLPGMEASFVDIGLEKNGFLYVDEIVVPELEGKRQGRRIQDLISRGEDVLVQAVKDPMGTKGARLTTEVSLPGRFLVYTPFGDGIGVSRRLDDDERERLKAICRTLELPEGGIIVRTAAEGASEGELAGDLALLQKLWSTIQGRAARTAAPALVYREAELPLRVVRDVFRADFERLAVDHERTYRRIVSYLKRTSPELAGRVEWYREKEPLMERSGVDAAVRSTLARRVDLPSGGYLVFDYAEAFTVIDVNTGRFVGARGKGAGARLEDTITKNNLEATREIVRQLRLRDIGGIIVIDFIDMANPKNRHEVEEALRLELERDRTKTYVVEISPLGLVEMTRQNVTDGPREILTTRCHACEGDGIVVSEETYAVEAERKLRRLAASSRSESFLVELAAAVAGLLIGPAGSRLAEIERETGRMFAFETHDDLPHDHFRVIVEGPASEVLPSALPVAVGQEIELELLESHMHHRDDAIGRLDGYVIAVAGAAGRVGETVTARIERATRTVAYAVLADAATEVEAPVDPGTLVEEDEAAAVTAAPKPRKKPARSGTRGGGRKKAAVGAAVEAVVEEPPVPDVGDGAGAEVEAEGEKPPAKKRTRRGTRGGRGRKKIPAADAAAGAAGAGSEGEVAVPEGIVEVGEHAGEEVAPPGSPPAGTPGATPKKRTRRGSRGGRGRKKAGTADQPVDGLGLGDGEAATVDSPDGSGAPVEPASENGTAQPKKRTRRGSRGGQGRKKTSAGSVEPDAAGSPEEPEPIVALVPASGEASGDDDGDGTAAVAARPRARRGSRGGRGRRRPAGDAVAADTDDG